MLRTISYLGLIQAVQCSPDGLCRASLLGLGVGILHLFHLLCKLGDCCVLLCAAHRLLGHNAEGELSDDAQSPNTYL